MHRKTLASAVCSSQQSLKLLLGNTPERPSSALHPFQCSPSLSLAGLSISFSEAQMTSPTAPQTFITISNCGDWFAKSPVNLKELVVGPSVRHQRARVNRVAKDCGPSRPVQWCTALDGTGRTIVSKTQQFQTRKGKAGAANQPKPTQPGLPTSRTAHGTAYASANMCKNNGPVATAPVDRDSPRHALCLQLVVPFLIRFSCTPHAVNLLMVDVVLEARNASAMEIRKPSPRNVV